MLTGTLPQVSNRATFEILWRIKDAETLEPVSLADLVVVCQLAPSGEWPWVSEGATLLASSDGGTVGSITELETGVCQILFPLSAMRVCAPRVYAVGITVMTTEGDETCEPFVGQVSIIDGVVP